MEVFLSLKNEPKWLISFVNALQRNRPRWYMVSSPVHSYLGFLQFNPSSCSTEWPMSWATWGCGRFCCHRSYTPKFYAGAWSKSDWSCIVFAPWHCCDARSATAVYCGEQFPKRRAVIFCPVPCLENPCAQPETTGHKTFAGVCQLIQLFFVHPDLWWWIIPTPSTPAPDSAKNFPALWSVNKEISRRCPAAPWHMDRIFSPDDTVKTGPNCAVLEMLRQHSRFPALFQH